MILGNMRANGVRTLAHFAANKKGRAGRRGPKCSGFCNSREVPEACDGQINIAASRDYSTALRSRTTWWCLA